MYTSLFAVDVAVGLAERLLKVRESWALLPALQFWSPAPLNPTPALPTPAGTASQWAACCTPACTSKEPRPAARARTATAAARTVAHVLQSLASGPEGEEWVAARLRTLDCQLQSCLNQQHARQGEASRGK